MERSKDFEVVARFLVGEGAEPPRRGWRVETMPMSGVPYSRAAAEAQRVARSLDETYGNGHFWTVDLYAVRDGERTGSYFQLFHGRTS